MARRNSPAMSTAGIKAGYVLVFVAAAVLYVASCAPGPVWQDSGVIQYRVWHNDIKGKLGLALSHPLFYIFAIAGRYVPLGEFAWRVNATSAVISAVAVANLFLLLALWFRDALAAVVGAVSLGLSHTFWRHAALPETYNLTMALLFLELVMLLQYARSSRRIWLYWLAFLNGLSISNHMLASLPFVCYLVVVLVLLSRREIRVGDLVVMALLWIAGALPYEYLIVRDIAAGGDIGATLSSAAFGDGYRADVLNTCISGRIVKENLMWMALNFPTPNVLLGFLGISALGGLSPKRWFARVVVALLLVLLVFAFRYTIVDRYAFFIPFYGMFSILIGAGTARVLRHRRRPVLGGVIVGFCLLTVPAYVLAPAAARRLGVMARPREIPYRDDYRYFLQPWRTGYRGAERFAEEVFELVEPRAVIYADSTTAPPLLYAQEVKAKRPDVAIISRIGTSRGAPEFSEATVERLLRERPIYVVSAVKGYYPEFLEGRCDFEPAGIIYRVVPKQRRQEKGSVAVAAARAERGATLLTPARCSGVVPW